MAKPLEQSVVVSNHFELKNIQVDLLPSGTRATAHVSVADLEALRDRGSLSASKYGLETICGASCETGAQ